MQKSLEIALPLLVNSPRTNAAPRVRRSHAALDAGFVDADGIRQPDDAAAARGIPGQPALRPGARPAAGGAIHAADPQSSAASALAAVGALVRPDELLRHAHRPQRRLRV